MNDSKALIFEKSGFFFLIWQIFEYINSAILSTVNKITADKKPYDKKKITLNVYTDFLNKKWKK